jgi:hypothetical protein
MTPRLEPKRSVKHNWLEDVLADRGRLDGYAVAVATGLWSHMNRDGICWPSLRLLADETKTSQNTVQDRIKMLEDAGLLTVKRRPRGANTYHASASRRDTDSESASSGDAVGRRRRSASPESVSASSRALSASSERLSASSERLSASPGDAEHVNPRRGEHVNQGALSGGAPDGSPALGASAYWVDEVKSDIEAATEHAAKFDTELYEVFDSIGRGDPPDDMLVYAAFVKRLEQSGCYEIVDLHGCKERHLRADLTREEAFEVLDICETVIAWATDEASAPGWALRNIQRRDRFIAEVTKEGSLI